MLSSLVKFPCGKQWSGTSWGRSLQSNNTQSLYTLSPNSTHSDWGNSTLGRGNSTLGRGNSSDTEEGSIHQGYYTDIQELEANDTRIVGGLFQRQGGSPWQVMSCAAQRLKSV